MGNYSKVERNKKIIVTKCTEHGIVDLGIKKAYPMNLEYLKDGLFNSVSGRTKKIQAGIAYGENNFNLGLRDFTISAFLKIPSDYFSGTYKCVMQIHDGAGNSCFNIYSHYGGARTMQAYAAPNNNGRIYNTGINIMDDAWHHVAVARKQGIFRVFLDGCMVADISDFAQIPFSSASHTQAGNVYTPNGNYSEMWIDNFVYVEDVALWTDTFEPLKKCLFVDTLLYLKDNVIYGMGAV